jgi:hypothetical protein
LAGLLMVSPFILIRCHCEERSDEAIHSSFVVGWIASLRSQ